jgi:hypothetical protein
VKRQKKADRTVRYTVHGTAGIHQENDPTYFPLTVKTSSISPPSFAVLSIVSSTSSSSCAPSLFSSLSFSGPF